MSQNIYFLKTAKISDIMQQAYDSLNREYLSPFWIILEDVENLMDRFPGSVLVIDSVDSEESRKIRDLRVLKAKKQTNSNEFIALRIFTAFALVSINPRKLRHLPVCKYPIASICMKNCHVTLSGFSTKVDKKISKKVLSMGASHKRGLHGSTSYVISNCWTTKKIDFLRRHSSDPCVVRPEWVERCWERREHLKDAKELVDQFRLPVFAAMNFCISGFEPAKRSKLYRIIAENGGSFSKGLHLPVYKFEGGGTQTRSQIAQTCDPLTTHLIVSQKSGPKYEAAMNSATIGHSLHIVNDSWLLASKKRGFPLPEDDPNFKMIDTEALANLKKQELDRKRKAVLNSSLTFDRSFENQSNIVSSQETPKKIDDLIAELREMLNSSVISTSKIFDNLSFYVCGFSTVHTIDIKKIITRSLGTVYAHLPSMVTHVVIGPQMTSKEALNINRHQERVRTVSKVDLSWIINCIKKNEVLAEPSETQSNELLNRIHSTQDLDENERLNVIRERAAPTADVMDNKLKELEMNQEPQGTRTRHDKKRLRIGGGNTTQYSPIRITRPNVQNESIPCSIPIDYAQE